MPVFFLVVLGIYGAMHSYLLLKLCIAFPGLGRWRLALAGFMLLMIVAPLLARLLERWRHLLPASAVGLVGYLWLAVIFWFCVLMIPVDAWNLAVRAVCLAAPAARSALVPARAALVAIGGIIVLGLCWGLVEASRLRLKTLTVEVPHLSPGGRALRLAQISDLHLGPRSSRRRVAQVAALIKQAQPDILVSTGDLVDSSFADAASLAAPFRDIHPPLGKFAVLGNHEFYAGLEHSLAFHEAAGFRVLRGECVTLGEGLRLAGVDDPAGWRGGDGSRTQERDVLSAGEEPLVTVLLKHRPEVDEASLGRFRLQLSGHTHGGQIFPFHLVTRLMYPLYTGRHELPKGSTLYASRGAGTWGPPLRVLSPREVVLITLKPASPAPSGTMAAEAPRRQQPTTEVHGDGQ